MFLCKLSTVAHCRYKKAAEIRTLPNTEYNVPSWCSNLSFLANSLHLPSYLSPSLVSTLSTGIDHCTQMPSDRYWQPSSLREWVRTGTGSISENEKDTESRTCYCLRVSTDNFKKTKRSSKTGTRTASLWNIIAPIQTSGRALVTSWHFSRVSFITTRTNLPYNGAVARPIEFFTL